MTAGIHHLSLGVGDIQASLRFRDAALAPLGLVRVWSDPRPGEPGQGVGYGEHCYAAFVIDPDGHRLEAVIDTPD